MSLTKNLVDNLKDRANWPIVDLLRVIEGYDRHLDLMLKQQNRSIKPVDPAAPPIVSTKFIKPVKINRGDVLKTDFVAGQAYCHPGIVWKIKKDICYCLVMSSKRASHNLHQVTESRFFPPGENYVTKTIVEVSMEDALKRVILPFDNRKELRTIFMKAKEYYSLLIN